MYTHFTKSILFIFSFITLSHKKKEKEKSTIHEVEKDQCYVDIWNIFHMKIVGCMYMWLKRAYFCTVKTFNLLSVLVNQVL